MHFCRFFMLRLRHSSCCVFFFFFQAEDGIRDHCVTGVQTCALPICLLRTMRAALIDGHRGSRPEAPAVVYVPHADLVSIAAVALAGAGAGYRLRGITYQRDALSTGAGSGSGAAAVCDSDRDVPLLRA